LQPCWELTDQLDKLTMIGNRCGQLYKFKNYSLLHMLLIVVKNLKQK